MNCYCGVNVARPADKGALITGPENQRRSFLRNENSLGHCYQLPHDSDVLANRALQTQTHRRANVKLASQQFRADSRSLLLTQYITRLVISSPGRCGTHFSGGYSLRSCERFAVDSRGVVSPREIVSGLIKGSLTFQPREEVGSVSVQLKCRRVKAQRRSSVESRAGNTLAQSRNIAATTAGDTSARLIRHERYCDFYRRVTTREREIVHVHDDGDYSRYPWVALNSIRVLRTETRLRISPYSKAQRFACMQSVCAGHSRAGKRPHTLATIKYSSTSASASLRTLQTF